MMDKIISGEDISLIWNLSCIDISCEDKYVAFKQISEKGDKNKILYKLKTLKNLFDVNFYNKIISLF